MHPADEEALARLRAGIDAVDDEILDALERRARLVRDVATWKQAHGRPFYVPERERQILARLEARAVAQSGPFPVEGIRAVFSEIISACLSLEQRLKVSFLGPEATFTHGAARSRFGLSALYLPSATIAGVFTDVEKGRADVGVVPVENSTEGVVSHTLDLFVDSPLAVLGEIALDVQHCLLTRAPDLPSVQKVYSHPQALAQCRAWLGANLPGVPTIEVASTALAARLARDDTTAAAVASEIAARLYDLRIVVRNIEDERVNITRFLVVARPGGSTSPPPPTGKDKTSLMFSLHDAPGALQGALALFADAGINLTRIESRPSRRRPWEYVFFADIDGHADDAVVAAALARFRSACADVKLLGSYPRAEPAEST